MTLRTVPRTGLIMYALLHLRFLSRDIVQGQISVSVIVLLTVLYVYTLIIPNAFVLGVETVNRHLEMYYQCEMCALLVSRTPFP